MTQEVAKRATLMELAQDAIAFEQLVFEEKGELNETLEKWLGEVQTNLATKADNYHFAMDRFEATADMLRKRADQIMKAARTLEGLRESLRFRISSAMELMQTPEVQGMEFRFKRVKGKDRVVIDERLVHPTYFMERVVRELDKAKLVADAEQAITDGKVLPAGIKFEPSFQLRSYVKK